jgi:hypothetical protein
MPAQDKLDLLRLQGLVAWQARILPNQSTTVFFHVDCVNQVYPVEDNTPRSRFSFYYTIRGRGYGTWVNAFFSVA